MCVIVIIYISFVGCKGECNSYTFAWKSGPMSLSLFRVQKNNLF